ncbi:MAG TPA: glycosyltransferase family 1 protein [Gemmatimonadales bacterium]|jgi:glycosyltransferase involved in cell wall biosynthesis
MRVLFCTDTYPPQVNGVSIVTALSVDGLSRLGWECAVAAPWYPAATHAAWSESGQGDGKPADLVSLPSIPLPGYSEVRLALPSPSPVHRLVERFRPDLLHCATEFSVGRMGQLAAARAKLPVVSSYHTDFARYADAYGKSWLRGTVSSYLSRFHRRSRRVYTPSTVSREDLLRLDVSDVEVWGRGVDGELFHPSRRTVEGRAALGLGDRFTFLYVGRLAPEKRAEQIVDAFRLASDMLPPDSIRLIMAGTGPREAELRAVAPPGVTFLGFLERRTRLPALYANCDAFVFASVTETLGLVVLEAMASGLPVIAAPAGGVRDHLRDGQNGLAYPAGSAEAMAHAMVKLAGDCGLARHLSRGARCSAEELTWEREMERLDRSYREVCRMAIKRAAA